jgi:hypothetical protein
VILYRSDWQSETVVDRPIDRIQGIAVKTVVDRRSDDANKIANQGSKLKHPDFVLFLAAQNLQFSRFCEANMLTHTLKSDEHNVNRQGVLRETRQLYRTRGRKCDSPQKRAAHSNSTSSANDVILETQASSDRETCL